MSETIALPGATRLEGGFRTQVLETLHEIRRAQTKFNQAQAELEQIVQSAASKQNVDLTKYVLDVDALEFVARPVPPTPATPTVALPEPPAEEPKKREDPGSIYPEA